MFQCARDGKNDVLYVCHFLSQCFPSFVSMTWVSLQHTTAHHGALMNFYWRNIFQVAISHDRQKKMLII